MRNILLTGATGFIGQFLISDLLGEGFNVSACVRETSSLPPSVKQFQIGDFLDDPIFDGMFENVDTVIHLAAHTGELGKQSSEDKNKLRIINVEITEKLARLAAASGVRRFIFLSSIKVNGEGGALHYSEQDIPSPIGDYGRSKLEAEMRLFEIASNSDLEVVIIRPPIVYGRGQRGNFHRLAKLLEFGLPLPFGGIKNKRSFCSVQNLSHFILTVIAHPKAGNQIFCVSDKASLSTSELLRLIGQGMGKSVRLFPAPVFLLKIILRLMGKKDISDRLFSSLEISTEKAERLLLWCAPLSAKEGINRIFD